jgi:uncharacterized membrane protein
MSEQRCRGEASTSPPSAPPSPLSGHVTQNVDSVLALHHRDRERRSPFERVLEFVGHCISRPMYLLAVLGLVLLWIAGNTLAPVLGLRPFDAPPFALLQGLLTLGSFATTTVVVIAQRRQARLESQRSHLDLQVNLLSEQKVTKVIHLLE